MSGRADHLIQADRLDLKISFLLMATSVVRILNMVHHSKYIFKPNIYFQKKALFMTLPFCSLMILAPFFHHAF